MILKKSSKHSCITGGAGGISHSRPAAARVSFLTDTLVPKDKAFFLWKYFITSERNEANRLPCILMASGCIPFSESFILFLSIGIVDCRNAPDVLVNIQRLYLPGLLIHSECLECIVDEVMKMHYRKLSLFT